MMMMMMMVDDDGLWVGKSNLEISGRVVDGYSDEMLC